MHRCFRRHGISRLPETQGDKTPNPKFKAHPIGFVHIDIAEVRTEEGKLYLFVAIDRGFRGQRAHAAEILESGTGDAGTCLLLSGRGGDPLQLAIAPNTARDRVA